MFYKNDEVAVDDIRLRAYEFLSKLFSSFSFAMCLEHRVNTQVNCRILLSQIQL